MLMRLPRAPSDTLSDNYDKRDRCEDNECDEDQCCGGALNLSITGVYDRYINT